MWCNLGDEVGPEIGGAEAIPAPEVVQRHLPRHNTEAQRSMALPHAGSMQDFLVKHSVEHSVHS